MLKVKHENKSAELVDLEHFKTSTYLNEVGWVRSREETCRLVL